MAKGKHKGKKLRRLTIEPAENGYNVQTEHEPDADDAGGGGGLTAYQPPKSHVFGHHEHAAMMQHVAEQVPPPDNTAQGPAPGEAPADWLTRAGKK